MPVAKAYQATGDRAVDRSDHVWFRSSKGWKCCFCGGFTTALVPPDYPTPKDYDVEGYELPLTQGERSLCPLRATVRNR